MWKNTKRETNDGKTHVGRGRVSCFRPEIHIGRGVHASENARRGRSSRVGKHMLGDQRDSVPWIVSVSATIVHASGKRTSGEVFTGRKTYVGARYALENECRERYSRVGVDVYHG